MIEIDDVHQAVKLKQAGIEACGIRNGKPLVYQYEASHSAQIKKILGG